MITLINFLTAPKDTTLRLALHLLGLLQSALYRMQDDPAWRSADGRVTRISHMGDDHLRNAIAMIERRGEPFRDHAYPYLILEDERRRKRHPWTYDKRARGRVARSHWEAGRYL